MYMERLETNLIKENYPLSEKDLATLRDAIADTASKVKVNITDLSDNRKIPKERRLVIYSK